MMPGDGVDHILSKEATAEIISALEPRLVIPMHYRLSDLEVDEDSPGDLGEIEPWLEGRRPVGRTGSHIASFSVGGLPVGTEYLVFDHAPYLQAPTR